MFVCFNELMNYSRKEAARHWGRPWDDDSMKETSLSLPLHLWWVLPMLLIRGEEIQCSNSSWAQDRMKQIDSCPTIRPIMLFINLHLLKSPGRRRGTV
nr:hypothetical protein Q903MT_gene4471 [Picea sitchensis]